MLPTNLTHKIISSTKASMGERSPEATRRQNLEAG